MAFQVVSASLLDFSFSFLTSFLFFPKLSSMTTTTRKINGAAVKALRDAVGVKQGAFASRCSISQAYLNNIEAGRRQPAHDVTARIAHELGVSVDAITYPSAPTCSAKGRAA